MNVSSHILRTELQLHDLGRRFLSVCGILSWKRATNLSTLSLTTTLLSNSTNYDLGVLKRRGVLRGYNLKGVPATARPGEGDGKEVSKFIESVRRQPTLDQLSATPFYAISCWRNFRAGNDTKEVHDEIGLIDLALHRMCEREYQKGALTEDVLPADALIEWLEELAGHELRRTWRFSTGNWGSWPRLFRS